MKSGPAQILPTNDYRKKFSLFPNPAAHEANLRLTIALEQIIVLFPFLKEVQWAPLLFFAIDS
jgi:hypothetical protein